MRHSTLLSLIHAHHVSTRLGVDCHCHSTQQTKCTVFIAHCNCPCTSSYQRTVLNNLERFRIALQATDRIEDVSIQGVFQWLTCRNATTVLYGDPAAFFLRHCHYNSCIYNKLIIINDGYFLQTVLWHCWLSDRKGIWLTIKHMPLMLDVLFRKKCPGKQLLKWRWWWWHILQTTSM